MPKYTANKAAGESHNIPDDEVVVEQHTVGGEEILVTEKKERYICDECGEQFYEKNALWGHKSAHSN